MYKSKPSAVPQLGSPLTGWREQNKANDAPLWQWHQAEGIVLAGISLKGRSSSGAYSTTGPTPFWWNRKWGCDFQVLVSGKGMQCNSINLVPWEEQLTKNNRGSAVGAAVSGMSCTGWKPCSLHPLSPNCRWSQEHPCSQVWISVQASEVGTWEATLKPKINRGNQWEALYSKQTCIVCLFIVFILLQPFERLVSVD